MAERELFVICNNCGSEVSPYVTECPYCGHRLRKRAPDLKKVKKQEEKDEKRAQKKRDKLRAVYEGGGEPQPGSYLGSASNLPIATIVLVVASVVISLVARVDSWFALNLVFLGDLPGHLWQMLSAPLVQVGMGYGFVCLTGATIFGAGIEARFGPVVLVLSWAICGAFGVLAEYLIAPVPFTNGALAVAIGLMTAWLIVVVTQEDLRDYDGIGLGAVGAVLLALPIVTDEASVWTLVGGLVGGGLVGAVLMRLRARAV
jgi:membrane associated rhomboid family serine protease/DNA-directed RNA polymerase subunit RPC12/RpoP